MLFHFVVDDYSVVELNNFNYIRRNQQQLRADCYKGLMDALGSEETTLAHVGSRTKNLPSYIGSPRHMKGLMQDAMAICRRFGRPEFFITFTCNPNWLEILAELDGTSSAERPDLIACVPSQATGAPYRLHKTPHTRADHRSYLRHRVPEARSPTCLYSPDSTPSRQDHHR